MPQRLQQKLLQTVLLDPDPDGIEALGDIKGESHDLVG